MSVEKPVAIVTGGGSGIGRACAVRFAGEGVRVVVVDRSETDGQKTVDILKAAEGEAIFVQADVSAEGQCRAFAKVACDAFGRIDILVACAGIRVFGTVLEATEEDWDRILAVNLKGVSFSCKAVLPKMIEQHSGAIVLIGSTTAMTGRTDMPIYDATKFGVLSLTRSLAATYGKDGIRANAVCPSLTLTEFQFKKAAAKGISPAELRESQKGYGMLGRPGEPEEIASVVYFMASKEASFVTGQYLIVDGGYSIGSKTG
jgi:meso-butanediol dehydrogenase/(S,S)-butanediol dehydrogenase/diacetyl reductase